jgi:hypothetical protein
LIDSGELNEKSFVTSCPADGFELVPTEFDCTAPPPSTTSDRWPVASGGKGAAIRAGGAGLYAGGIAAIAIAAITDSNQIDFEL